MAEVVDDLVAEVEDEGEGIGRGVELARVGGAEDGQARVDVLAGDELADEVEARRGGARAVGGFAIGAQDAAVADRDSLRAVQQLRRAPLERARAASTRCATMAATTASMKGGGTAIGPPRTRRR
jgi:hypothetical protein